MTTDHCAATNSVSWLKSSYSTATGNCVELASLGPESVAVRDSKHPGAGALVFSRSAMSAWLDRCRAGEFDRTAL